MKLIGAIMSHPTGQGISADKTVSAWPMPAFWRSGTGLLRAVLVVALVAGGAVHVGTSMLNPVYRASTRIVLTTVVPGQAGDRGEFLSAQMALLTSPAMARRVAGRLHLAAMPTFASRSPGLVERFGILAGLSGDPRQLSSEERAVERVMNGVRVSPASGLSGLGLDLSFDAVDGNVAADVANGFVTEYRALQAETAAGAVPRVISPARAPSAPLSPRPWISSGIAAIFGALATLAIGALLRRRHEAVDDEDGMPAVSLSDVAFPPPAPRAGPVTGAGLVPDFPPGTEAPTATPLPGELEDDLLGAFPADGGGRRIVVSATDGDGGERWVIDALVGIAGETGRRVVVVDAERASRGDTRPGLTDLVVGEAGYERVIRRNPLTRAHTIARGRQPLSVVAERPEGLRDTIAVLANTYDVVLIALGAVVDDRITAAFLGIADRVIVAGDDGDPGLETVRRKIGDMAGKRAASPITVVAVDPAVSAAVA